MEFAPNESWMTRVSVSCNCARGNLEEDKIRKRIDPC